MSTKISILSEEEKNHPVDETHGALPFQPSLSKKFVTTSVSDEKLKNEIVAICESLHPTSIDPDNRLGVSEIELALVVSGEASVKLLGEVKGGVQASIKVILRRPN